MISKSYSSNILNAMMGKTELTVPANIYLGLCASEPDLTTGSLANAGEPTSVDSYERKLVGGIGTKNTQGAYVNVPTQYFATSSSSGVIKNSLEIQLKTAREDYPEKIHYWFLSTTNNGVAYAWGKIKDVLQETKTVNGFMSESNAYFATIESDELLGLKNGATYIVAWDGVEYEEIAHIYEADGTSYIRLGNTLVENGEDDKKPFGILYNESTTGTETVGNLRVMSLTGEATHDVAIYASGITVKKATVPTFYEEELQMSIDAI